MKAYQLVIAISVLFTVQATAQQNSFTTDSHLNFLFKNAMMNRHYSDSDVRTRREWGQAAIAHFTSGFTPGPVGIGADILGQLAVRLDGGRGRSGAGGIDYFSQNSDGHAQSTLRKLGGRIKAKVGQTVVSYGTQQPLIPLVTADTSRLLYETYTGWMLESQDITGVDISAGYLTAEQRKSSNHYNSGLGRLFYAGARYQINSQISVSAYAEHIPQVIDKQFSSFTYTHPISTQQKFILDINGYNSRLTDDYAREINSGRSNIIWSTAGRYVYGMQSFKLAYQQNSGSTGFHYGGYRDKQGLGDGGIWVSNSYWSDFIGQDERSWQVAYSLDLTGLGLSGLSYDLAYVSGTDIHTSASSHGKEREVFNQLHYVVPSGPAKDLQLTVRYSRLQVSADAADYNRGGSDLRLIAQYPITLF
ncbi:OprD family outer membrane porin [Rosenbergiella collisarenosi]|uniref:OprD family outer membrane porin n=1 Tax=Rosenbergiella collisarenosi TaxID=1544695 RepID=UPI001F50172A|nr:OprD family outer membrane porin [Rosenbergiella collisarenosi]